MKVKAKIRFNYGKKVYYPGDEIEMNDKDAKLLSAAGRITLDDAQNADSAKTSQKCAGDADGSARRGAKADAPEAAGGARNEPAERSAADEERDDAKGGKKARGGYKRRDMRATDERADDPDNAGADGDE
jgi:hypothetical protein